MTENNIYLLFDIYDKSVLIGQVNILINKNNDMDKFKNPLLCVNNAINQFKLYNNQYNDIPLKAYHIGDLIPKQ